MVITIEEFFEQLKKDRLGHYIHIYAAKILTLAVCIDIELENRASDGWEKEFFAWCTENCNGYWSVYNEFWVLFELDSDAMAFKLRWI